MGRFIDKFNSVAALSQQWVDQVQEGDKKAEDDIRTRRGDRAADRYRDRATRSREKMQRRVDPELTILPGETKERKKS